MSIGLKILRDLGEAEDVTQAVFLEIYRVVAQFDAFEGQYKSMASQYAYHRSMNRRQYLKTHGFTISPPFQTCAPQKLGLVVATLGRWRFRR